MLENWKTAGEGAVVDAANFPIPTRVRNYLARAQYSVEVWIGFVEARSCSKTVNKSGFAAGAVRVGEEVEHLKSAGVGEVRCVGMDGESESGVCGVCRVYGRGEIPKSAVVGWPNESNTVEEGFGGACGGRTACDEREAEAALFRD